MTNPAHTMSQQVTAPSDGGEAPASPAPAHPLFSGKTTVGMISAENPRFQSEIQGGHEALGDLLRSLGLKHQETQGRYGSPERSYLVYGPSREQMFDLGRRFGQEAVVFSQGGRHEMLYSNGPKAGRFHPSTGHELFDEAPSDYFTWMPDMGKYLRLAFDWDSVHPAPLQEPYASAALKMRAQGEPQEQPTVEKTEAQKMLLSLRKYLGGQPLTVSGSPHPHAYPWHNGITRQNMPTVGHGVLIHKAQQPEDTAPIPEPVQSGAFNKVAVPFGSLSSGHTQLSHYPLLGKGEQVDQLVRDHGFQLANVGGRYGRPDHAVRNYDTKHLPVHDTSHPDAAVQEYTAAWRKSHELAHALTHAEVNQKYGEGRRVGKLGKHLTTREALRAVHWEWLAAHRQRGLLESIGVTIPDHVFNRELNTLMHDAVHRVVSGEHTDPSGAGFQPHAHEVPVETALGVVREQAHNLGLQGMNDLLKKSEGAAVADDREITVADLKKALNEAAERLKARVREYEQSLVELRKRELAKAERCKTECEGVLPGDKPSEKIDAPGSGGQKKKGRIPSGRKLAKALPRIGGKDMASQQMTGDAFKAHAAKTAGPTAPPTKMPSPAEHANRANDLASFMPPGKFSAPAAKPQLPKLPSKPGEMAKPPAGVGHLNAPSKIGGAPKLPAAAAAPGAPAPAPAAPSTPKAPGPMKPPVAPKAGAPAQKSEEQTDDLTKNETEIGSTVAAIRERAKK